MVNPIPESVKKAWNKWNVRGVVLFSLSLQAFLILFAPFRKTTARKLLILLIWSAYLLADWAANFAVGLISQSQEGNSSDSSAPDNPELLVFWAPFLLVHLGGPDTITAFALEDNELWLRHLLSLIFQAIATGYVFIQTIPRNKLWIPTTIMFVAGIIKYVERTRALYLASLDKFRDSMLKNPDPGPNYAKLMEEYASKRDAKLPTKILMIPEPDKESKPSRTGVKKGKLTDLEVLQYAHEYYKTFKGLIVDLIFSFRERDETREFFFERDSLDALKVIEVELNFIYEALYTKVEVMHSKRGVIFRFIAFFALAAALGLFHFRIRKTGRFEPFDVRVTYTLLLGGLALDVIAFLMFIFSDWTFATLIKMSDQESDSQNIMSRRTTDQESTIQQTNGRTTDQESAGTQKKSLFNSFVSRILSLKKPRWYEYETDFGPETKVKHHVLITPIMFRRWSRTISVHNLIGYCLKKRPGKIYQVKSWSRLILENLISLCGIDIAINKIGELMNKIIASIVIFCKDYIVRNLGSNKVIQVLLFPIQKVIRVLGFLWSITSKVFGSIGSFLLEFFGLEDLIDEVRFLSHEPFTKELWDLIFTEVRRKSEIANDPESVKRISSARGEWFLQDRYLKLDRNKLMDYVVNVDYEESLLLWHIATELCYQTEPETAKNCINREISKVLSDYMLYLLIMQPGMMSAVAGIGKIRFRDTCAEAVRFFKRRRLEQDTVKNACRNILSVNTYVKPIEVKGDRSKSVLFDGSMLANELKRLEEDEKEDKWEIISKVWVELMSYAASHCDAKTHAQQVTKGGEVISFVWLLMAHFGLGEQFQINEGHARAKLIVGK